MKYILSVLSLIALLIISFSQTHPVPETAYLPVYLAAEKEYKDAEKLSLQKNYSEQKEADMNHSALKKLLQVAAAIEADKKDSLAFQCHLMIGSLFFYFDSLNLAKEYYGRAIRFHEKSKALPDSFLFKPLLFSGSIYYSQQLFDSAESYYGKAEAICNQYAANIEFEQRLYERLGVIYFETGNYQPARYYFEKALSLLPLSDPFYTTFKAECQNHIASALLHLEQYDSARSIYLTLLPLDDYKNEAIQHLGLIDLNLGKASSAISWLKKATITDANSVLLYNKIAKAYLELKSQDSAEYYLRLAEKANEKWNGPVRNEAHGLTCIYEAESAMTLYQLSQALNFYQQAIIQFHNEFSETAVQHNPETFNGAFSYIHLFKALNGKAEVLRRLHQQKKEIALLDGALETYRSAFRLVSYVEQTYDSDEARLFLAKIQNGAFSKPVEISIQLYELTGKIQYLEQTYYFDQLKKASLLALNMQESEGRKPTGLPRDLFEKEKGIKKSITRISQAARSEKDSSALRKMINSIRDLEIDLGNIREQIKENPAWSITVPGLQIPSVTNLQRKLDNNSVLVSYHLSEHDLLLLLVSNRKFEYYKTEIDPVFYQRLKHFKTLLQAGSAEQRYEGTPTAQALYQVLIKPIYPTLKQYTRLVVIPDGELNSLAFEALQDENKKYLLEQFSVQYQFSTVSFGERIQSGYLTKSLAFAPYASNGITEDSSEGFNSLLPASKKEVESLKGQAMIGSAATKARFLHLANSYPLLHLATHAIANNDTPSHSYISFYPDDQDHKLYAGEIASMRLDSVRLVILSACETGNGQLMKGEGLMSLSRAFARAGCPDMITSLWKAEDRTTAFITRRLHYYLEKRLSKDLALQQAKIDLLKSDEIDPRYKSPEYWAHLIYIGNYEEDRGSKAWWWIALTIIGGAFFYKMIGRKK